MAITAMSILLWREAAKRNPSLNANQSTAIGCKTRTCFARNSFAINFAYVCKLLLSYLTCIQKQNFRSIYFGKTKTEVHVGFCTVTGSCRSKTWKYPRSVAYLCAAAFCGPRKTSAAKPTMLITSQIAISNREILHFQNYRSIRCK